MQGGAIARISRACLTACMPSNKDKQPAIPSYNGYLTLEEMLEPEREALRVAMDRALTLPGTVAGMIVSDERAEAHKIRAVSIPSPIGTIHAIVSSVDDIRIAREEVDGQPTPVAIHTHESTQVSWWQEGSGDSDFAVQYPPRTYEPPGKRGLHTSPALACCVPRSSDA